MAVREILEIPHPILRQRARKVRRVDKRILQLAYDMVDTMREAGGVGLAANQVGELRRLIVLQIPEEEEVRIYFNPEIIRREGTREVEEGCLSYPGYRAIIERSAWIRFGALDHTEKQIKVKADGLLAQAMEHEVDHLNGILYTDHMEAHEKLIKVVEEDEAAPEPDDADAAQDDDTDGTNSADADNAPQASHAGESGLWLPEQDSRNTPATLKIK